MIHIKLVGSLQYLTFTRPDIAFSVHCVNQFMHKPTFIHFSAVKRIPQYLCGTFTLAYIFTKVHSLSKLFVTLIRQVILLTAAPPQDSLPSSTLIQSLDLLKSNLQFFVHPQKHSIVLSPLLLPIFTGSNSFYVIFMFISQPHQHYGVTMLLLYHWLTILFFMQEPNTLRLITVLFEKILFAKTSLPTNNLLIYSQSHLCLPYFFTFETNY